MKKSVRLLVFCLFVLSCLSLAAFADREAAPANYRTEVSVQRATQGAFVLAARVTDLGSGKVLAMPTVKTPAGEEANAESTDLDSGTVIKFSGKVDSSNQTATYTVRVERTGKVVTEHSATLALQ
ncbi:MAG TPA: hypothetical protein VE078_16195 [Thermoanaerobaculia bacterium]|nr:hypothetical protein [Thermoanaerobaculia bacterium]